MSNINPSSPYDRNFEDLWDEGKNNGVNWSATLYAGQNLLGNPETFTTFESLVDTYDSGTQQLVKIEMANHLASLGIIPMPVPYLGSPP